MAGVKGRGSAAAGHLALVAMVLLAMAPAALAANHDVGGATQKWDYAPSNDLSYYDNTWAPSQTFIVGDTLQFVYASGAHDVVQLGTQSEYAACAGTTVNKWTSGNDSVPLTTAGTFYYICSFPGHCTGGMKLSVTVKAAVATPTPAPTATPPPPATLTPPGVSTPPPPPPPTGSGGSAASSGPVLSMAGLLVAALVATLAFLV